MKTYIAGPMRDIPLYNFPAFDAAEARLNRAGVQTINPAALDRAIGVNEHTVPLPDGFMEGAMRRDLAAISSECEAIVLLPGWEVSSGVEKELGVAEACGLRAFLYVEDDPRRWGMPVTYDELRAIKNSYVISRAEMERLVPRTEDDGTLRQFDTGATRDTAEGKLDFEGFLSPRVLFAFAEYMLQHQYQSDGTLRASDNWQKGIPKDAYMKSMFRHFMDAWALHRGLDVVRPETGEPVDLDEAMAGLLFNVMGYWHETLKEQEHGVEDDDCWCGDPKCRP